MTIWRNDEYLIHITHTQHTKTDIIFFNLLITLCIVWMYFVHSNKWKTKYIDTWFIKNLYIVYCDGRNNKQTKPLYRSRTGHQHNVAIIYASRSLKTDTWIWIYLQCSIAVQYITSIYHKSCSFSISNCCVKNQ